MCQNYYETNLHDGFGEGHPVRSATVSYGTFAKTFLGHHVRLTFYFPFLSDYTVFSNVDDYNRTTTRKPIISQFGRTGVPQVLRLSHLIDRIGQSVNVFNGCL